MSQTLLPPALIEHLGRMRLTTGRLQERQGSGGRVGSDKGQGFDFADHRRYRAGDDLRHLDVAAYARLREPFVKVYHPQRPANLTLVVDASASMNYGRPSKIDFAKQLAAGLACVGLGASDRVRIFLARSGTIHVSRAGEGPARLNDLLRWLEDFEPGRGVDSLEHVLSGVAHHLPSGGSTIVISDFLDETPRDRFFPLAARDQRILAFQILDRSELSPKAAPGQTRLLDSESGAGSDIAIDEATLARYAEELRALQNEVRASADVVRGRFHVLATDTALEALFTRTLPALGVLE